MNALKDPASHIRVVTIQKNCDFESPVSCTLQHVDLNNNEHVSYTALSYACGSPQDVRTIILEGREVLVYANLVIALRYLRQLSPDADLKMWIDAICIDQNNPQERAAQVLIFPRIYECARSVVAWLGEGSELTTLAMKTWPRLAKIVTGEWNEARETQLDEKGRTDLKIVTKEEFERLKHEPTPIRNKRLLEGTIWFKETAALMDFLSRPYFTRLWVYQELTIARKATYLVGYDSCNAEIVNMGISELLTHLGAGTDSAWPENLEACLSLARRRRQDLETRQPQLIHLLARCEGLNCSDPRDRIFAILSVADDRDLVSANPPTYETSTAHVFKRLTRTYIRTKKNLDLLSLCRPSASGLFPSWTLNNWDVQARTGILYRHLVSNLSRPAFRTSPCHPELIPFDDESNRLCLAGFPLSTVQTIGPPLADLTPATARRWSALIPTDPRSARPLLSQEEFWLALAAPVHPYGLNGDPVTMGQLRDHIHEIIDFADPRETASASRTVGEPALIERFRVTARVHSFFVTDGKHVGSAVCEVQTGDLVCVLFGGQTPFVLRPVGRWQGEGVGSGREIREAKEAMREYMLVGDCYVHGVMMGEAMREFEAGGFEKQVFCIV